MKNFRLMVLMLGSWLMIQSAFAQKGKITSAQLSLEEGKVMEAKKDIDAALQDAEVQKMVKAWFTKGDVYKGIYETNIFYAQNPNCLFDAKEAYLKAYGLETNPKKYKDYTAPLTMLSGFLFNEGLNRFNGKKYEDAYKHFDASRGINEFLKEKGLSSAIDTNTIFATAMSGANANKTDEILPLLQQLVDMNFDNPAVYETLAQVYEIKNNKEGLSKVVSKGLAKYPNNKNLQIYELNATLDGSDAQDAIAKFEKAAQNDPTNATILFNLGVLYDKQNNLEKAKVAYEKAIAIKPDYGDAYFNLGVMYFNDGVELNKKMNAEDDLKKYEVLKKQRDDIFLLALPNLEKAYSINPKNQDYKQNLKKVYASMNFLDKARGIEDGTYVPIVNFKNSANQSNTIKIKFKISESGVHVVPVKVNDLQEIDFVFDTGASETTITSDVVSVLIRQKIINEDDFLEGKTYKLADGSVVKSPRFKIKKIQIGDVIFNDVEASIVSSNSDPLLGQNVLKRFTSVKQDNKEGCIILEK